MSAAARASALSNPLTPAMTGARRCGGAGRPVAVGAEAGRGAGVGGAGAGACAGAGAAATGTAAAGAADAGAGILIVGAAVGLGGKLIRTVSFFGCTLAASVGFGGTAPEGGFGMLSAITFWVQARVDASTCQMLIRDRSKTVRSSDFLEATRKDRWERGINSALPKNLRCPQQNGPAKTGPFASRLGKRVVSSARGGRRLRVRPDSHHHHRRRRRRRNGARVLHVAARC